MSISLPELSIKNSIAERQTTRFSSWESNFEKNHNIFAKNIAYAIAKQTIEDFQERIKDPYKKPISSENEFVSNISFEITSSLASKKIVNLTAGYEE